jgi:hypothetical protein
MEVTRPEIEGVVRDKRCRQLIDQIRRDEFGVGIELNEEGQRLMKVGC